MKLRIPAISIADIDKLDKAPCPDFWESTEGNVIWLSRNVKSASCSIEGFEQPCINGTLQVVCELNYDEHQDAIAEPSSTRHEIEEEIKRLKDFVKQLEKKFKKKGQDDREIEKQISGLKKLIEKWRKILEKNADKQPDDEIQLKVPYTRLGYYTRENNARKIVMLMRNCIREDQGQDEPAPQSKEDARRFLSTYIHELFHAYFDSDLQRNNNHLPFIEEPIVEYAMLKFIANFQDKIPFPQTINLLEYAEKAVQDKQYNPATSHYGFGYFLWKWEQEGNAPLCDWIELFRKVKYDIGSSDVRDQYEGVFKRGFYPFEHEEYFMNLLYEILNMANGGTVSRPSHSHLHWEKIGPKAFAAIDNDTLYLDGAFIKQYKRRIDRYLRAHGKIVKKIILGEHYVCDTFKRLGNYSKIIAAVDSKNYYYKMGIVGNVVDK